MSEVCVIMIEMWYVVFNETYEAKDASVHATFIVLFRGTIYTNSFCADVPLNAIYTNKQFKMI